MSAKPVYLIAPPDLGDEDDEQLGAGSPDTPSASPAGQPPHKRMRLSTQEDVARQLRRLVAAVQRNEISGIEAVRRAKVLRSLAEVMTSSSIERRLALVEKEAAVSRKSR